MRAPRIALLALAAALPWPAAAADFGEVELVQGQVTVRTPDGRALRPKVGDRIAAGSDLATGKDGELHIATADSGFVALRANTQMRIAEYRADGGELDTQILSLVKGTLRSITGWIGKYNADRYQIRTPTATIGARGTDHEPAYLTEEDLAAAGADATREPGTYDKVNEGGTFIENESGRVDIDAGQAGFAHTLRGRPARLGRVPEFFKGTRHEQRILERRELLKQVREKRRLDRRELLKKKLPLLKERRKAQDRRQGRDDRRD